MQPVYLAIAESLSEDIRSGRLAAGHRLPTQRTLAYRLGVTVGTVSRAYREAERRGLVTGEVGRGTFVRPLAEPMDASRQFVFDRRSRGDTGMDDRAGVVPGPSPPASDQPARPIDLAFNLPFDSGQPRLFRAALAKLAKVKDLDRLLAYQPECGAIEHRRAGSAWITAAGLDAPWERVVLCNGAQHALSLTFATIAAVGDLIVTEQLSYPTVKTIAGQLGLRLAGLPMDDDGLIPEAFEQACRAEVPKALFCLPDLHNPTTATMPDDRRREIAAIARRYGVWIIEDDVYGFLAPNRMRPLCHYAPERSFYLTGVSKCFGPGLRVGYILCPADRVEAVKLAMLVSCRHATPLTAALASGWIADGTAARMIAAARRELALRHRLLAALLAGRPYKGPAYSLHAWLPLPLAWRADAFVAAARERGVLLPSSEVFAVSKGLAPHAVRVCLGATRDRAVLSRGLGILANLLDHPGGAA